MALNEWHRPRVWAQEILWIPNGTGTSQIASLTAAAAHLPALPIKILLRLKADKPLQAGEYDLTGSPSIAMVIDNMRSGRFIKRSITIPEGLTSFQIMNKLRGAYGLADDCPPYNNVPEGSLLPDTYAYTRGEACTQILARMQGAMIALEKTMWPPSSPALPYKNWGELVTMASIIERETGLPAERPTVAGVFVNRLRLGMKLQSDPTTIYALSKGTGTLDRPLWRSDWAYVHPYNTYVINGLPPGPIAHPGLASLRAALAPQSHDYLYFMANGQGGHDFAASLGEHNKNVALQK